MRRWRTDILVLGLWALALSRLLHGQPDPVVEEYLDLKRTDATAASIEERLGRIAGFESLLRQNAGHRDYASMMFWLGQSYSTLGDPGTAVALFDELRHLTASDARPDEMVLFELGLAHLRAGESRQADATWQEIVSTSERGSSIRVMAVNRLYALRSDEARWDQLDDIARGELAHADGDRERSLAYLARAQRELGDFDDAAETFETILEEFGAYKSIAERLSLTRSALHARHRSRKTLEYLEQMNTAIAAYEPDAQAYAEYHRLAFDFTSLVDRYKEWGETPPMSRQLALGRAAELHERTFDGLRNLPLSIVDRDVAHSAAIAGAGILERQGRPERAADLLTDYLEEFADSSGDLLAIARRMRDRVCTRLRPAGEHGVRPSGPATDPDSSHLAGTGSSRSLATTAVSTKSGLEARSKGLRDRSSAPASDSGVAVVLLTGVVGLGLCGVLWLLCRHSRTRHHDA